MASRIVNLQSGNIAVVTPYNPQIIAECKRRMGRWQNVTIDGKTIQAWVLDGSHRAALEPLLVELFPPRETLIERVVTWTKTGQSAYGPTMDGYDLVGFGRDNYWIKRFDGGEPIQVIEIINDDLDTGGSRNNPRLFGSVTLRLRCRSQAIAAGDGWTVEVLD